MPWADSRATPPSTFNDNSDYYCIDSWNLGWSFNVVLMATWYPAKAFIAVMVAKIYRISRFNHFYTNRKIYWRLSLPLTTQQIHRHDGPMRLVWCWPINASVTIRELLMGPDFPIYQIIRDQTNLVNLGLNRRPTFFGYDLANSTVSLQLRRSSISLRAHTFICRTSRL